jgi:ParB family chromosome partitioning protein
VARKTTKTPEKPAKTTKSNPAKPAPSRLGRGLSSLISNLNAPPNPTQETIPAPAPTIEPDPESPAPETGAANVDVNLIKPNPYQPRKTWNDDDIKSLAASIKQTGLLQPVLIRRNRDHYELIAGERRWRAAQLAGMSSIPALINDAHDEQMLEFALVENIQREDLNAIDRAQAYRRYRDRFGLTTEDVARSVGEDRTTVTNYIRLLELQPAIRDLVADGRLSMGHARALLGIESEDARMKAAKAVIANSLSVRALEQIARRSKYETPTIRTEFTGNKPEKQAKTPHLADLEERFARKLGTKVQIEPGRKNQGKITISYYSLDDFDRIAATLGVSGDE